MIIYSKTLWGVPLLTRIYGSALPRAIAPAVISGLITMILLLLGERVQQLWDNPFAYQPFVLIVSFVLTFRSNYAYQRHWEAYTQMQTMTARWIDAAVQAITFDKHPVDPIQPHHKEKQQQYSSSSSSHHHHHGGSSAVSSLLAHQSHQQFVAELVHLISLLHAVACAALRRDPNLHNLTRHSRLSAAPPSDPALLDRTTISSSPGTEAAPDEQPSSPRTTTLMQWAAYSDDDIVGAANWRDIFMLRGSSKAIRKYNAAQPLPIIGGLSRQEAAALGCKHDSCDELEQAVGLCTDEPWGGVVGGRFPGAINSQIKHRRTSSTVAVNSATAGNSSSNLWGLFRSRSQQSQQQSQSHHHHRSQSGHDGLHFSTAHSTAHSAAGSAKSGRSGNGGKSLLQRSISRRFKVSQNHACCAGHLPYMDRPMLVLAWVHELLVQRQAAGGLRIPAPILARVHTCLSDGLVGFEQCRKLADVPFPFPWAQFVLVMLVIFTVTLPLLVLAYIKDSALAVVVTVMTVTVYWAVNEVARDVEDPFLYEPNDMPLANTQYHINEMLLALSATERPASGMMPIHLPGVAAAAGSLVSRLGSAAGPFGSAASASWPNLGQAAAAAAASDHADDDPSWHDDTAAARQHRHRKLPTIFSGDEGFLRSQAAAAVAATAAAAAAATPFAAAELQGVAASPKQQQQQQKYDSVSSNSADTEAPAGPVEDPNVVPAAAAAAPEPSSSEQHISSSANAVIQLDTHAKRVQRSSGGGSGNGGVYRRSMETAAALVDHHSTAHDAHQEARQDTDSPRDSREGPTASAAGATGRSSFGGGVSKPSSMTGAVTPAAAAAPGDAASQSGVEVTWEETAEFSRVADMV